MKTFGVTAKKGTLKYWWYRLRYGKPITPVFSNRKVEWYAYQKGES